MKIVKRLGSIFRKELFFSFFEYKQVQEPFPLILTFEVELKTLDEFVLEEVISQIEIMKWIGCQVRVIIPTEQIPDGYIGRMTAECGEILKYPVRWLIRQEYFDKTQLAFQLIH